jgi:hypothetical protein
MLCASCYSCSTVESQTESEQTETEQTETQQTEVEQTEAKKSESSEYKAMSVDACFEGDVFLFPKKEISYIKLVSEKYNLNNPSKPSHVIGDEHIYREVDSINKISECFKNATYSEIPGPNTSPDRTWFFYFTDNTYLMFATYYGHNKIVIGVDVFKFSNAEQLRGIVGS